MLWVSEILHQNPRRFKSPILFYVQYMCMLMQRYALAETKVFSTSKSHTSLWHIFENPSLWSSTEQSFISPSYITNLIYLFVLSQQQAMMKKNRDKKDKNSIIYFFITFYYILLFVFKYVKFFFFWNFRSIVAFIPVTIQKKQTHSFAWHQMSIILLASQVVLLYRLCVLGAHGQIRSVDWIY